MKDHKRASWAVFLSAVLVALGIPVNAEPAHAAMAVTVLGTSNGGYSFTDVGDPSSLPGDPRWVPSA